ncbi:MAG TPA: SH3 domain-containing protein, partial [Phototrophicaceae bacterium]|nr:SH3 domain-containing protein [Phototrophicaceae bacterium]
HTGNSGSNFVVNSNTGSVTIKIQANVNVTVGTTTTLNVILGGGLTFNAQSAGSLFTNCAGSSTVTCTTSAAMSQGTTADTITFTVKAPSTPGGNFSNSAILSGGGDTGTDIKTDGPFSIVLSGTNTPTPTGTLTPLPTFPIPTFTVVPTLAPPTAIPTATFIPNPPTSTPLPRPANAGQAVGPIPHPDVTIVVDRDGVNVRSIPALGAPVLVTVNAGYSTNIIGRSGDGQWVQVKIAGQIGWIGTAVLAIVNGDINSAPVNDPLTIPYGGWENPRAGLTSVTSSYTGKLDNSGLRVRSGPGSAYVVLANAPRYTVFSLLGRTDDNMWVQVNYDGTLGWVAAEFVDFQQGLGVFNALPIDGIVADALPVSSAGADSYTDTLKLMQARIDLAQPSLDSIRSTWTTIALGNRAACSNFPARPSDLSIPNPVLAASYPVLFPLDTDFNSAMASLRQAIDLFITICGQPQPPNGFVGQPVVQNALDAVNQTDALFASLRQRLAALLPPEGPIDNDTECLFSFQNRSQIVPRLKINEPQIAHITKHDFVLGFCFDAGAGQSLSLQVLKINGNAEPRITVSSFGDATNFLGTANLTGNAAATTTISPILITQTDRYLAIMADLDGAPNGADLQGDFALLLTDVTATGGAGTASLAMDAAGNVIVNQGGIIPATPGVVLTPGLNNLSGNGTPGEALGGAPTPTAVPVNNG